MATTTNTTSKIVIAVSGFFLLFLIVVSVVSIYHQGALFIPGFAPTPFKQGAPVTLDVNKVTSDRAAIPYRYHSLPVCSPDKLTKESENLGAIITGNRLEKSLYTLNFNEPKKCEVLCTMRYSVHNIQKMKELIKQSYSAQWQIDDLPAASITTHKEQETTHVGFPLGSKGGLSLHNHVNIIVKYVPHKTSTKEKEKQYNIVFFQVQPSSYAYSSPATAKSECMGISRSRPLSLEKIHENATITFTYSVDWQQGKTEWAHRWEPYYSVQGGKIHWFAIINSLLVIFILTGMVAVILTKTLRQDFLKLEDDEEAMTNEAAWKNLNAEVFRAPRFPIILSVLVGSGVQVLSMAAITLVFSLLGFLSPANQGSLVTAVLVLYVWMGMAAGYSSARIYQVFGGENTTRNTLLTALLVPGILFGLTTILNIPLAVKGSSGAFPFTTALSVFALWVCISVPLCYLGARFARSYDPISVPGTVNLIPRLIPDQRWYMHPILCALMSGLLPFGAIFIELHFILSSIWLNQYYYLFGFLFLVFLIMMITCAQISVVMCYFQLSNMDWRWWWRAFLNSGASSFYVFLYSIYYFTQLEVTDGVAVFLYFGYTFMLCFGFFLLTGTIGFAACFIFVKRIYKAIHQD